MGGLLGGARDQEDIETRARFRRLPRRTPERRGRLHAIHRDRHGAPAVGTPEPHRITELTAPQRGGEIPRITDRAGARVPAIRRYVDGDVGTGPRRRAGEGSGAVAATARSRRP